MISGWAVYLVLKLDDIRGVFLAGTIASGVITALLAVMLASYGITGDDPEDRERGIATWLLRNLLKAASMFLLFLTVTILIPTTRQFALIYIIPKVVNSDFVQKDIPAESREIYELGKDILKQTIKEWRNEGKDKAESKSAEKVRTGSGQ